MTCASTASRVAARYSVAAGASREILFASRRREVCLCRSAQHWSVTTLYQFSCQPARVQAQNTRPSPWRQLQSSAMPARRDKQRSCSRSDANMLTKYRRCYKRLRGARFLQYTRTMLDDRGGGRSRKWLPGARRDTQTDVSRTVRGVWYVISGQETKFGGWRRGPCAGPRVTTTTPTLSPHYDSSTRFI